MAMQGSNEVTLFSNGIGHFRRKYLVAKEFALSIPFKKDHIGDVAASLQVFGNVRYNKPPSFTPSNSNATALKIDANNALKGTLRSLSGTVVRATIQPTYSAPLKETFTLIGIETENVTVLNGSTHQEAFVVLMNDKGIVRYKLSEIVDIFFEDPTVRTEIEKALKNNYQLIKPDSTLLDLSLQSISDEGTEAVVQYTIPVAAWKMRYAIRQESDSFFMDGAAIIDNNTDEDWTDFKISVVTGSPISFETNIASVCVPKRKYVKLIDDKVLGNVDAQDVYEESQLDSSYGNATLGTRSARASSAGPKMAAYSNCNSFGFEAVASVQNEPVVLAESAGVDNKEVGDFCVFTNKTPITILSRKSAIVQMFSIPLNKAGVILFYKEDNHPNRPYRAIKFKNESEFSLGKGKTVVYNDGIFSGECVLDTTKPNENRILPHCLENGVKVYKDTKPYETRRQSIKVSDGVGMIEEVYTSETTYRIENKKDEKFNMAIEHVNVLSGYKNVTVSFALDVGSIKEKEKLSSNDGHRAYVELEPKKNVTVTVVEKAVSVSKTVIYNQTYWINNNLLSIDSPLSKNRDVLDIFKIQNQLDVLNKELQEFNEERKLIEQQAARIRTNLASAKEVIGSERVNSWVDDLSLTEKQIMAFDKEKIPLKKQHIKNKEAEMAESLKKLSVSWTE